jgi:Putative beta-barrel porin-2, OmpL-like. bbp2
MKLRIPLVSALALAAALPSFAQIKINNSLTVTGWAVGSEQYTQPKPGTSSDSTNINAAELQVTATPAAKTTVVASAYYVPSGLGGVSPSGSELTLLDAYVTYAASDTLNITAGKFLSYLGYESFYLNQDNMITLANQALLAPIPGYHTGLKLDYSPDKTDTMGVSVTDSEYQKPGYAATEGDGEFKHNAGMEAYYTNTAITNLTLWMGVGYETKTKPGYDTDGVQPEPLLNSKGVVVNPDIQDGSTVGIYDIWATYTVDKAGDQIAAEEIYKDGGFANKGSNWLAYFLYNVPNSKVSSWFCISGEDVTSGASYVKYSVAPRYTYNANLSLKLQYSYTKYHNDLPLLSSNFLGAEVVFQF